MSIPQIISLVLLLLVMVGAVWQKINIGILALCATFILVLITGTSADKVYDSFPANLVVLIIGVSLMFSHLEFSGAIRWIIDGAFRIMGDHAVFIPWVGFLLGGFLSTVGIFGTGPVAILVPIFAFISVQYPGTYLINGLDVIMGSIGLGVSPLNPTGATIQHLGEQAGATYSVWGLWGVAVVVTAVAAVLQLIFRPVQTDMLAKVPWAAVLLIGGLLTYLGLLRSAGTIDAIQDGLNTMTTGVILVLVLAYATAGLCNVESSALGILSLTMPLAFGFFGDSSNIFWIVAAIAVPSGLMVMNPIHIAGALVVANAQKDRQNDVFRLFLYTSLGMTVVVPGVLSSIPLALGT